MSCSTLFIVFCLFADLARAQTALEMTRQSHITSEATGNSSGPTSIPQTFRFFARDTARHMSAANVQMTVSLNDQQYMAVPLTVTGISFGAQSGKGAHSTLVTLLKQFADASDQLFSGSRTADGFAPLSLDTNPGLQVFLSTNPLHQAKIATSDTSRHYYGMLRIDFDKPVDNPVLSIAGIGGRTNLDSKIVGYTTELALLTPNLTFKPLSSNKQFVVSDRYLSHAGGHISGHCQTGAACGSVLIEASAIRRIDFGVYLRSDGRSGIWAIDGMASGDTWLINVSATDPK